jgi:hypothetical protein
LAHWPCQTSKCVMRFGWKIGSPTSICNLIKSGLRLATRKWTYLGSCISVAPVYQKRMREKLK